MLWALLPTEAMHLLYEFSICSVYYLNTLQNYHQINIQHFVEEYNQRQYRKIQDDVDRVVNFLDYYASKHKGTLKEVKLGALDRVTYLDMSTVPYMFVLKLLNLEGGKDFAEIIFYNNKVKAVGKRISDDKVDLDDKLFLQEVLKDIRNQGFSYMIYKHAKPDEESINKKLTLFYLYKPFNWIITSSVFLDEVNATIEQKRLDLEKQIQKTIVISLLLTIAFALIITSIFYRISKQIYTKLEKNEQQLMNVNKSLEVRVRERTIDLQNKQEQLSVTLRSIADGVITTDAEGNVVLLNKVAEELTGWIQEEAKGQPSSKVFHIINEKTGQKCSSPIQRVLELGRIIGLANHTGLIAKDGTIRSIADSGAPIRDRNSTIVGVVLVFRDVTHERRTEEELLKVRKLESVGVLAGGIAHDFNNILSAVLGNIELASYRIAEEDVKTSKLLLDARKATKRATKLTNQLLTFSKGGEPVKEKIALNTTITESANFVLHGSKTNCTFNFFDDLWMVDADSGQIGQVIQNIVINAKHAMPEGGTIQIQCANVHDVTAEALLSVDKGDYIRIAIQDTGIGIPKEIHSKIFDPYFSTKQEGSGLGLAICHSIIHKHDGHITVQSIPGKGTTFIIFLPAVQSTDTAITKALKTRPVVKAARIMVMDDDEMIRNVAQAQLTILGHGAVLVVDGEQAINKYQELQDGGMPVDLVIMDLTIPGGMGGQEASRKLLQIAPEAKIIVASGYSNDPVIANYREHGFCAAIAKPFDLNELRKAIESVLS